MFISELTSRLYPPSTDRGRSFISQVIEQSPLLRAMQNFSLSAQDDQYRPSVGGQALASRQIAGGYTATNLTPAALIAASLKIEGFVLDYDESFEKDHETGLGIHLDTWLERELRERSYDISKSIENSLIKGKGGSNDIVGLAQILNGTNIPGLGITGVVDATTLTGVNAVSLDLAVEANQAAFVEGMEKVVQELDDFEFILCNRAMAARLTTIAQRVHKYTVGLDEFGKRVEFYAGVPIVRVENTTIGVDEPDNTSETPLENTTSIYIGANSETPWSIKSNSGLAFWDIGELEDVKMSRRVKFEFRGRHQINTKRAIRRIRNIKL